MGATSYTLDGVDGNKDPGWALLCEKLSPGEFKQEQRS